MSKSMPSSPVFAQLRFDMRPRFVRGLEHLAKRTSGNSVRSSRCINESYLAYRTTEPCQTGFGETSHAPQTLGAANL